MDHTIKQGWQFDFDFIVILRRLVVVNNIHKHFLAVFASARGLGEQDRQRAVLLFALHQIDFDRYVACRGLRRG